ncbi:hypothetical protein D7M11_30260 [Paenibacillus ginsengarvi]|uniref:Beta-galactosidase trimerisation domain-containing protein n=2 Tax=Paenibacillus ginsengarvi TaxID=400777 RepID=A0A3B0BEW9_9BACL|nr:hypothetical protein D7M11_30260 [Paenibacillus ginsengarvi]
MSEFVYMLRYTMRSGELESERFEDLMAFCRNAGIDDVMFFIHPMHFNHMTLEETRPWLKAIQRAKPLLASIGVTTSINPLNTLLHESVGGVLKQGQRFQVMVDPHGNRSSAVACPLCPEWRRYIVSMYAAYAELEPHCLWIEDDFRFHNHRPLLWGGCFCDAHLSEFASRAGVERIDRDDFVQGMLAEGPPHLYRRIWLDACREQLVDVAAEIADAVHQVSPRTRLGLMTSDPAAHAIEGRDWHGLLAALDGVHAAAVRPTLPAYRETTGMQYAWNFHAVSRLTASLLPFMTPLYPELENVPYTSYAKSHAFERFQLETGLLLGSKGITLNILDMAGNGVYPEERHERWLREQKDFAASVAAMHLHVQEQRGVGVLVNERSSYTLATAGGKSPGDLAPRETFWAGCLSACGIANRYVVDNGVDCSGAVALSGQVLRNYSEAELRELFARCAVLLDGEAAFTLYDMGLGSLCGIARAEWFTAQFYERIADGRSYAGIANGRMRPFYSQEAYLRLEYDEAATVSVLSRLHRVDDSLLCPGMTVVNERVFIMPCGWENQQALLHPIRRAVLHDVLLGALRKPDCLPPVMMASYAPHVAVFEFAGELERTICLLNASLDEVSELELTGIGPDTSGWMTYSRSTPFGRPAAWREKGETSMQLLDNIIPPLSMVVLRRSREEAECTGARSCT